MLIIREDPVLSFSFYKGNRALQKVKLEILSMVIFNPYDLFNNGLTHGYQSIYDTLSIDP